VTTCSRLLLAQCTLVLLELGVWIETDCLFSNLLNSREAVEWNAGMRLALYSFFSAQRTRNDAQKIERNETFNKLNYSRFYLIRN